MSLVHDAVQSTIGASEPWPDDATLFQQFQVEQITLPDTVQCIAVETFLHICGLKFKVQQRVNAEEMSPSGQVPFIRVGAFLISEFDPIVAFAKSKGFSLSSDLTDTERSEMKAYMSMVDNILTNAEVTKPRYSCSQPWPLRWILPWRKQREVRARLVASDWHSKSVEQVRDQVTVCCGALSERLGDKKYFFGEKPTELDAVVFGHLYTLLTTVLPGGHFTTVVQDFQKLTAFCKRIEDTYFRLDDQ